MGIMGRTRNHIKEGRLKIRIKKKNTKNIITQKEKERWRISTRDHQLIEK